MNNNTSFQKAFSFDNVDRAYNGKSGCMCGCNGDYANTQDNYPDWQGTVNVNKAKRRYNMVMNHPDRKVDVDGSCVYVNDGNRTTVVYFK